MRDSREKPAAKRGLVADSPTEAKRRARHKKYLKMINQPKPLVKGDTVAIVCSASKIDREPTDAINLFESWGLNVILGKTVHASYHQFAGDDALRTQDLQQCLDDDSVKAIFAARGGYGTIRIIDRLDFSKFKLKPKWIVGFSDVTVLHSHLQANYGIETIHGQMPLTIPDGTKPSIDTLRKALFNEPFSYEYSSNSINRSGETSGIVIGGNLSLLVMLSGSISAMDYRDKILFIEDVGEQLYAIDRMLWMIKRSGNLAHLKGLIVGGFSKLKEDDEVPFGQTVHEIVMEHVKDYSYPVCFDFPAGHIADNQALIFGRKVSLKVGSNEVRMTYGEGRASQS